MGPEKTVSPQMLHGCSWGAYTVRAENAHYRPSNDGFYQVKFRVDPDQHFKMMIAMQKEGLNRTEWIREAIRAKLSKK